MKKLMAIVLLMFAAAPAQARLGEALRTMPVQDGGRVKPYDSFARETLSLVYGKQKFEDREAWMLVLTWMLAPEIWTEKELFEVRNGEILSRLGLPKERRWFKGTELFGQDRFSELMQELAAKRESKEKLTPYFQALQRLENQFFIFREMATGRLLRVYPSADEDTWLSVADLEGAPRDAFLEMTKKFVAVLGVTAEGGGDKSRLSEELDQAVMAFEKLARTQYPDKVASAFDLSLEVHYNDFHPFRWAYVIYLLAALLLLLVWTLEKNALLAPAWILTGLGFLVHTYGFVLRVYLADRPPVTNMYETVVWVAWGAVVFAVILELIYKSRFILLAGNLVGLFALIVADSAPVVLDPTLQPLEAVLRSNYWLIVHVMTITISYAAFFLAFVLGDLGLIYMARDPNAHREKIRGIVNAIYRSMQIGVAFLAPGIILGGIWADYSWGRFWGWDPKETWALIVLLGYIAVLHGRMTNWIRDFGMIASGVVTFSLVIMAWYGVNFVLGTGLHSYGFGAGGVEYVSVFVALHLLGVIYVGVLLKNRKS